MPCQSDSRRRSACIPACLPTLELVRKLKPMTDGVVPIPLEERKGRIEKARRLMREKRIDAIYIESGTSMFYFTGVRWGASERMFAVVIPARGEVAWICPKFEEERARELIKIGDDIRTWEEDESPYKRVAEILRDRGLRPEPAKSLGELTPERTTADHHHAARQLDHAPSRWGQSA